MALVPLIEHVEPRPRESYWQRGCDDAKAGRPMAPPPPRLDANGYRSIYQPEQDGYYSGYDFGKPSKDVLAKYREPT